jgi:uncharacterized protein
VSHKRVSVAYALRDRQFYWQLELPLEATVGDAIDAARRLASADNAGPDIPWQDAPVGIYGELTSRAAVPREGDRIELYRALEADPKESRRERVQRLRRAKGDARS